MKKILIQNNCKTIDGDAVPYFTFDDINQAKDDPDRETIISVYQLAINISRFMHIDAPYIGISSSITRRNGDGGISELSAISYTADELVNMDHNVIHLAWNQLHDTYHTAAILAHELRHFWQEQNNIKKSKTKPKTLDFLSDVDEIDADGFAVAFLMIFYDFDIEKSAEIVCKFEERNDKKAYEIRIKKAEELYEEMVNDLAYQKFGPIYPIVKKILGEKIKKWLKK